MVIKRTLIAGCAVLGMLLISKPADSAEPLTVKTLIHQTPVEVPGVQQGTGTSVEEVSFQRGRRGWGGRRGGWGGRRGGWGGRGWGGSGWGRGGSRFSVNLGFGGYPGYWGGGYAPYYGYGSYYPRHYGYSYYAPVSVGYYGGGGYYCW